MDAMVEAYQALNYDRAEAYAKEILADYQAYPLDALTQVHTTLGLIKYAQNNQVEAGEQFEAALSLTPDLALDPALVSPKILAFFDELKQRRVGQEAVSGEPDQVRYIFVEDPRSAAAMRSMMLPGWGQVHKGESRKGVLLMGLWGLTAGGSLVAHLSRQDAQRQYRDARNPEEIADHYDTYNRRNKIRNGVLLVAAGVWAYSYFDALMRPINVNTPAGKASIALVPATAQPYAKVQLGLRF